MQRKKGHLVKSSSKLIIKLNIIEHAILKEEMKLLQVVMDLRNLKMLTNGEIIRTIFNLRFFLRNNNKSQIKSKLFLLRCRRI